MLPPLALTYLVTSLEGHIAVFPHLLGELGGDDPRWDARPDAERFSLREVVAHLAAVEPLWLERAYLTRDQDHPLFPPVVPVAVAAQEGATAFTAAENLARFCATRAQYVAVLRDLAAEQWQRPAESQALGTLTIEPQAVFVLAHDGYHLKQIIEWLA